MKVIGEIFFAVPVFVVVNEYVLAAVPSYKEEVISYRSDERRIC